MNGAALQSIASVALSRIVFCLAEGTALALLVTLAVRLLPQKNSRTRFVIWLSALLATVMLPLLLNTGWPLGAFGAGVSGAVVTLPVSAATYLFAGWAMLALLGLGRVAAGLWQLRKMRANCRELPLENLGPELHDEILRFREDRKVALMVSSSVHVPTAIGFFKPAVILPEWLMQESGSEDVRHVVLHELEHLRRRDDWTNLLQKLIKALLFFHPAVWWMDRNMALDREMACDDAVLEKAASARNYAESLARVAEKSFLRRQIAMAQAAVGRLRQLSVRVARILDPGRPAATSAWKPAAPAVIVLAIITGVGLSWTSDLVSFGAPAESNMAANTRTPAATAQEGAGMPTEAHVIAAKMNTRQKLRPCSSRRSCDWTRPIQAEARSW
jgi:beta-lactamase regulating signal transducer with metallopeptidase domain